MTISHPQNPLYDPKNIFARILRGEIPCNKFLESPYSLAFHDIAPAAPVHLLVIPRGSYTDIHDFTARATSEEVLDFWQLVNKVTEKAAILESGFRLITNNGADSGQEVPHFHVHILAGGSLGPLLMRS